MDRPLAGVVVMITSAQVDARAAERFEARGATVHVVPLIAIGPPPDEAALSRAIAEADEFDWIAFSSANGVASVASRHATAPSARLAAIGPATAAAIRGAFGKAADLVPSRYDSEGLVEIFRQSAEPRASILLLQAQDARPVLAEGLRAAGFRVRAVAAYSTQLIPPKDLAARIHDVDVIVLSSASAVRSLVEGLEPNAQRSLTGKRVACIGPVTSAQARACGLHVDVEPGRATMGDLVEAICAEYEKKKNRG